MLGLGSGKALYATYDVWILPEAMGSPNWILNSISSLEWKVCKHGDNVGLTAGILRA